MFSYCHYYYYQRVDEKAVLNMYKHQNTICGSGTNSLLPTHIHTHTFAAPFCKFLNIFFREGRSVRSLIFISLKKRFKSPLLLEKVAEQPL